MADFKDWPQDASLIKRGSGRLVASDVIREAVGHIYVCEGVLQASKNGDLGKDSDKKYEIRVYNGASLLLTPENNDTIIIKERNLKIEGAGNRGLKVPGALAFDKKFSYQVIYNSSIELENDTVISSTGTASQNGLFSYVTLNMNSHKMILTCDDEKVAHFRFRFGRMIENAGTIVLDRAKLSSTDHKISINPSDTLVVELVHGGELAPYRASFYDEIASIICTSGRISTDSANLDVTLKDVSGPLTIDSKVTATITGAFGVKASDIVNGKVLTAEKALTFARGSYLALEKDIDLPAIIEGRPAVYRVASSAVGITGGLRTRGLTFGGCRYRTAVAEDAKSLELVQAGGLCVTLR